MENSRSWFLPPHLWSGSPGHGILQKPFLTTIPLKSLWKLEKCRRGLMTNEIWKNTLVFLHNSSLCRFSSHKILYELPDWDIQGSKPEESFRCFERENRNDHQKRNDVAIDCNHCLEYTYRPCKLYLHRLICQYVRQVALHISILNLELVGQTIWLCPDSLHHRDRLVQVVYNNIHDSHKLPHMDHHRDDHKRFHS